MLGEGGRSSPAPPHRGRAGEGEFAEGNLRNRPHPQPLSQCWARGARRLAHAKRSFDDGLRPAQDDADSSVLVSNQTERSALDEGRGGSARRGGKYGRVVGRLEARLDTI